MAIIVQNEETQVLFLHVAENGDATVEQVQAEEFRLHFHELLERYMWRADERAFVARHRVYVAFGGRVCGRAKKGAHRMVRERVQGPLASLHTFAAVVELAVGALFL